ncbi:flagellar hook-basal body complex protein [Lachnospiraceae bacterium 62-35]
MLRAMDAAVAGLRAHQNKMDVVGHNIANVNTFGFKAQTFTFKEAMYQTASSSTGGVSGDNAAGGSNAAQYGYGTLMGTIGMDMTASTPSYTGGFNATIDGEGFFMTLPTLAEDISTEDEAFKETLFDYTRVGQFTVDSQGYIVDGNNNFVYGFRPENPTDTKLGDDQKKKLVPLRAPENETSWAPNGTDATKLGNIQIDKNGKVTASIEVTDATTNTQVKKTITVGWVAIATFQNPNGLTKVGNSYYNALPDDNTGAASATPPGGAASGLMTGYIEASNVDLAKEFADMITTHRGFQANSKMITVSDEMLSDLVSMKR